eukprot:SAG22_NODE_1003_length_6085_cov_1.461243_2_plen_153_part_00
MRQRLEGQVEAGLDDEAVSTVRDEAMKTQDGPSQGALLVDLLVRTMFSLKPRSADQMQQMIGPDHCAQLQAAGAAANVAERLATLQQRLADLPEDGCIAMLPSISKLTAAHVPRIRQLARWTVELGVPQRARKNQAGRGAAGHTGGACVERV